LPTLHLFKKEIRIGIFSVPFWEDSVDLFSTSFILFSFSSSSSSSAEKSLFLLLQSIFFSFEFAFFNDDDLPLFEEAAADFFSRFGVAVF
jgi:hypothetical protein